MFHQMGNYEQVVNIENHKQYKKKKKKKKNEGQSSWRNSFWTQLTIAEAVIIYLGLDMLGNVSIDSHLMMDCVLK